jgi:hypothetical protein
MPAEAPVTTATGAPSRDFGVGASAMAQASEQTADPRRDMSSARNLST